VVQVVVAALEVVEQEVALLHLHHLLLLDLRVRQDLLPTGQGVLLG
jgi:hypothetical protein